MKVTLSDNATIPALGFGVAGIPPEMTTDRVLDALKAGYRMIDNASIYKNEGEVGEALHRTNIPRDDIFLTSKVWPDSYGNDATRGSFDESLSRLGVETIDLFLIHWPAPELDQYVETWRTLIALQSEGRVRSIGVSNFYPDQIDRLVAETGIRPVINQIECHPYNQRKAERTYHATHNIATECWSPLGRSRCLDDPVIAEIAATHGRTPAQVVLRWEVQQGMVAIPRSRSPKRIAENFAVTEFDLSADDIARLDALDQGKAGQLNPDPNFSK